MKEFLCPRGLSIVLVLSLCVSLPAAQTQSIETSDAPARRSESGRDEGKAAPASSAPASAKAQPLSEEESAKLEARDQEPGPEVAGGALSNLHLTYIVIALAAAVLVLILK